MTGPTTQVCESGLEGVELELELVGVGEDVATAVWLYRAEDREAAAAAEAADILDEYFDAQVAVDRIVVQDGLSLAAAAQSTAPVVVGVGVIVDDTAVALTVVVVTRFSPHALSRLA